MLLERWIMKSDERTSGETKKNLIFVRNRTAHFQIVQANLESIKLVFLSPNATSVLQPELSSSTTYL